MPDFNYLEWLLVAFGSWAILVALICSFLAWVKSRGEEADRMLAEHTYVKRVAVPVDWETRGWA